MDTEQDQRVALRLVRDWLEAGETSFGAYYVRLLLQAHDDLQARLTAAEGLLAIATQFLVGRETIDGKECTIEIYVTAEGGREVVAMYHGCSWRILHNQSGWVDMMTWEHGNRADYVYDTRDEAFAALAAYRAKEGQGQ